MSLIKFTYDRFGVGSHEHKPQSELTEERLLKYQNKIFQKQNQIDSSALQQYINSVRSSKIGKQRIFTQKTQITYIISNVFKVLKRMMIIIPQNEAEFSKILSLYMELIKSRENSRHHFGIIEEHLKDVLGIDLHRKNKKLYIFITRIFELNPYIVYKILQSKPQFLDWNSEESLKIYDMFIKYASEKKNISLILKQIKKCIEKEPQELERLKILLNCLSSTNNQSLIMSIYTYINHLIAKELQGSRKQFEICLLQTIYLFVSVQWSEQFALKKNQVILEYLSIESWRNVKCPVDVQVYINNILNKLQIEQDIEPWLKDQIHRKIKEMDVLTKEQSQNFRGLRILFDKMKTKMVEKFLSQDEVKKIVEKCLDFQLKQQLVLLLDKIKELEIYSMGGYVHRQLKNKIQRILSKDFLPQVLENGQEFITQTTYSNEDKRLALKALRKFKFDNFDVYQILKQYVLKNQLITKSHEIKYQVIKACLSSLEHNSGQIDKNKVMREILNLINKDLKLKMITIEWFRDNETKYDKKIFQIFKEPEYLHTMFQDYASNHMIMKRFSIKVLCFIYPLDQCEIVPFLKRVYYHIYDRLSSDNIVSFEEKKEALRLTREILRHRTQIIMDDSSALCNFLYNHLYRAQDYEQKQMNEILIELFKTIIDLIRKIPRNVLPFAYPITDYIIKLINSKDSEQKVKTCALNCFNQLIRGCSYVLIPYFHFKNLFEIIRQIFQEGSRGINHGQILRLLGNLGFVTSDRFNRMKTLTDGVTNIKEINKCFQKVYQQSNYLKQLKNEKEVEVIENCGWNGPYLFTKQETTYTYVEISNFKKYILVKINKILTEHPSKIIKHMVFKVYESFIPILNRQEESMYQQVLLSEILKPHILKDSEQKIFSLISKVIRFQLIKDNINVILNYLISLFENKRFLRKLELVELIYLVTIDYPTSEMKDDNVVRKIISNITQYLSNGGITVNQIKIGLKIVQNLAECIDNLIHLFLPQFNKSFLCSNPQKCLCYFEVILALCKSAQSTQFYLPPIIESLIELLKVQIKKNKQNNANNSLFIQKIIDFALCLIIIYGDRFKSFVSQFKLLVNDFQPKHLLYSIAEDYMKKHSTLNCLSDAYRQYQIDELFKKRVDLGIMRNRENKLIELPVLSKKIYFAIIEEFSCDKNEIEDESQEWFNKICIWLFEKSPELFVHECLPLVREDRSFCYDIFPIAFYFFWNALCSEGQKKLTHKLKIILESKVISLSVKQKILDTVYFMAQWKVSIPLKNKFLCEVSTGVLDSAKALFYMESLFENDPETYGEQLIEMYAELEQKQSAIGLLKIVQNLNIKTKILLNQKLKRYHDALKEYDKLDDKESLKPENMIMQITIRKEMSDWQSVMNFCSKQANINPTFKSNLAPLAVEASINLGKWEQVKIWLNNMPENHDNLNLWKTMFSIHEKNYELAEKFISEDRKTIFPRISQLFNFSFERSMEGIIRLQQLCELEEATSYLKLLQQNTYHSEQIDRKTKMACSQHRKRLQNLWNDRIEGSKKSLNAMQLLLMTRNLLLTKTEDISNWIDYCHLALRENQSEISKKTLKMLDEQLKNSNDIKKKFEIETLLIETKFILGQFKDQEAVAEIEKNIEERGNSKSDQFICRLYYNCALWLSQKQYDFNIEKGNKCIEMLKKTTQKIKNFIKGWHLMGLMHLKIDELKKERRRTQRRVNRSNDEEIGDNSFVRQMKDIKDTHLYQALHCFIKSVSCGLKNHGFFLEDCLKIMNILFNENQVGALVDELHKNYTDIPADGLIDIIPQIIGRLDIVDKPKLLDMMMKLLVHIGQNHPQSLVFYLIFLRRGNKETRKKIAEDIVKQLVKKQTKITPALYEDTQKIVTQLCKVSLKLNEKFKLWMFKVNEESRTATSIRDVASQYLRHCRRFRNENLEQLSISQFGFLQQYKQQLNDAINCLDLYLGYNELQFFRKAERIISKICTDLQSSLESIKKIVLEEASPILFKMKNTHVCIPGSYNPGGNNVLISSFHNELAVINSKQRPKKLIMIGSDGKQYLFLLKGKEDLRLDERIMQLFSLINKMFHDPIERENYSIKRYSITPISSETGLIEWVQNCDTIGDLIQEYRKITLGPNKLFLEFQICKKICENYQLLPKAHKVEIYKEIESRVSGNDLKNVFWIRSSSSEEWLRNRSCYTRSLAVMSMVGFVIGLGDRHPHNIMIQRNTGKVVHIDFGDCFDVNKDRREFPEKVPFRLTRMLVKNMQSCGIHGVFKHTCQKIIKMLRNNKQSIIAIIEAFRYDPILGWRLKGRGEEQMLENSYENNQTEESFLEQDRERVNEGDSRTRTAKQKVNQEEIALAFLNKIKKKLGGKFADDTNRIMSPEEQVNQLINEAVSPENLVEHFQGWSIYW